MTNYSSMSAIWEGFPVIGGRLEDNDLSPDEVAFLAVLAVVGRVLGAPGSRIRADVIEQVVTRTGPLGVTFVHVRRLSIGNIYIVGKVDLSDCVAFPVVFDGCVFSGEGESFDISRSEIKDLRLTNCAFAGVIRGENSQVSGNLLLNDCVIEGSVNLLFASVGGNFIVDGCECGGTQGSDLSFVLDGIRVQGLFQFMNSRLAGGLGLRDAHLSSQSRVSDTRLGADGSSDGHLLLQKARLDSELTIGPNVIMARLAAEALRGASDLVLEKIGGDSSLLEVNLDRAHLRGGIEVFDVQVDGPLQLRNGILGSLKISRSYFRGPGLSSRGTSVPGFDAESDMYAISADGLRVSDDLVLGPDLGAVGEVRFIGASIGGQIQYKQGLRRQVIALNLEEVSVGSAVFLDDMDPESKVHLAAATVGGIYIDPANLPSVSMLRTEYKYINDENGNPPSTKVALRFFAKDHMVHSVIPYRRFARWLAEEQGDSRTARKILIAGERRTRQQRGKVIRILDDLWRWTVGYGYVPTRAIWPFVGLVVLATLVFSFASGFRSPVDWIANPAFLPVGTAQPVFNPFLYALSATVPFLPEFLSPWAPSNPLMQVLTVVFQILGWLLITALVAGVANRIRRSP